MEPSIHPDRKAHVSFWILARLTPLDPGASHETNQATKAALLSSGGLQHMETKK
ncbi:hypothetical protein F2Q68_00032486 [Brassica cretica]|uniref:Uncharacterized protein n=1 Tax=Brassica cretica TaxID=69181 RepID=A0A8S9GLB3_BRACR|nr:hypothetical protein F2Q68_00032486 [Brassica cretica]